MCLFAVFRIKNNGLSERTLNTDIKEEFIKSGLIV